MINLYYHIAKFISFGKISSAMDHFIQTIKKIKLRSDQILN